MVTGCSFSIELVFLSALKYTGTRNTLFLVARVSLIRVNVETALTVYYASVYAKLKYGVMLWRNAVKQNHMVLVRKFCARLVFRFERRGSCRINV